MIVVVVDRIFEVGGGGGGRGGGGGGGSRLCGGDMQRPGVVGKTCWGERLEGGEHSTPTAPETPTLQPLGEGRTHVTITSTAAARHLCRLLDDLAGPAGRPRQVIPPGHCASDMTNLRKFSSPGQCEA